MNYPPLKDILPLVDKDQPFVILDQNGNHMTLEPGRVGVEVKDIINKPVTQITRFRYDAYAEEDFVALRVAFNKEDLLNGNA